MDKENRLIIRADERLQQHWPLGFEGNGNQWHFLRCCREEAIWPDWTAVHSFGCAPSKRSPAPSNGMRRQPTPQSFAATARGTPAYGRRRTGQAV
ncbi:hypothetical protein VTJ04DRAFT_10495 [Mycothermus thermophilus]|uniref:uncharacterized protein n=1 Tax=Humicola insolens TaxID=85995 RepID=UPI0037440138